MRWRWFSSEGVSDNDVVLSADERKRIMIGYGGIARRRSFGARRAFLPNVYSPLISLVFKHAPCS